MRYYGKEKCRILKQIRAEIARQNDIEWVVSECKHQGNCRGTCPKCEQEVRQLEAALARREALGKAIAVVGISAGLALSVSGCANPLPSDQGLMAAGTNGSGGPAAAVSDVESTVIMGDMQPPTESEVSDGEYLIESEDILMGDPVPDTFDEPTAGVPMLPEDETELDTDIPLPGEEPDTEWEVDEGEFPEETDFDEPLGGVPMLPEDETWPV